MTATIIILIVVSVLAIFVIATYNKLVRLRNMVEEGWSGIDVQLKRRANLIGGGISGFEGQPEFFGAAN
jgi:LemA protein